MYNQTRQAARNPPIELDLECDASGTSQQHTREGGAMRAHANTASGHAEAATLLKALLFLLVYMSTGIA